jgi:hypothetical protein
MMKFNFIFKQSWKCTKIDLSNIFYAKKKNFRGNLNDFYTRTSNDSKFGVAEEY